ncbi:MAG: hypothetical protein ACLRQF_11690 [Thomasclavelia ramosa]
MAKQHHIPTVSITANGDSPIAKKPIFILICCVEKKMLVLKLKDIVQQY